MPIYFFWGEDDFAINAHIDQLRKSILDPNWLQFNYDKLPGDQPDSIIQGLNQAMTPVFGMGDRLVWLVETNICQHCSEDLLSELKRTLPVIPTNSHLLFTSSNKPDSRLKSTKVLQQYSHIQEFALIPPWKTDELLNKVSNFAQQAHVLLTDDAMQLLAESVGNNTRQLWNELEKLSIYQATERKILDAKAVSSLVNLSSHSSLELAAAIKSGNQSKALALLRDLINRNEPALKIVATLIGQFRTWTILKLMIEAGEKDEKAIATAADIGNPKRIFFLRKEIASLSTQQLVAVIPVLLELEFSLKRGAEALSTLQTNVIQLCQIFVTTRSR